MWYNSVLRYYRQGRYTKENVKIFVAAGKLTPEDYKNITGEEYVG